jgi:peptide/nickel transport system permease protein
MLPYMLRRLCYSILVLWGVATIVFFLFNVLPQYSVRLVSDQRPDHVSVEARRKALRLDKPLWSRYVFYLNDLSPLGVTSTSKTAEAPQGLHITRLDGHNYLSLKAPYLGRSYDTKRSVSAVLEDALPGTIALALTALLLAIIVGIGLGLLAALKKGTPWDTGVIATYLAGISMPSFLAGLAIAYIFGYLLSNYTGLSMTGSLYQTDATGVRHLALRNLILPAIALAIRPMAVITQLTRYAMLDVLKQDYVRTAYAKGLGKAQVVLRHVLPNALSPVLIASQSWIAELLAGSFFVEYLFGRKGIGKTTVGALAGLDMPVVIGAVLLTGLIFIVVKLLTDLLAAMLDPRIRLT